MNTTSNSDSNDLIDFSIENFNNAGALELCN